jgi:hypothetical protein
MRITEPQLSISAPTRSIKTDGLLAWPYQGLQEVGLYLPSLRFPAYVRVADGYGAGVDLMTLRELMGHASITTTQRYCHPTPEHKREAVERLRRFNEVHFAASRQAAPARTCKRGMGYPQKSPQWVPIEENERAAAGAAND